MEVFVSVGRIVPIAPCLLVGTWRKRRRGALECAFEPAARCERTCEVVACRCAIRVEKAPFAQRGGPRFGARLARSARTRRPSSGRRERRAIADDGNPRDLLRPARRRDRSIEVAALPWNPFGGASSVYGRRTDGWVSLADEPRAADPRSRKERTNRSENRQDAGHRDADGSVSPEQCNAKGWGWNEGTADRQIQSKDFEVKSL